jgi:hypothetical protein
MRIILGLLGIGAGILMSLKSEWFLYNVGQLPSIEKYLGSFGGSRLFYQLLGVVIVIISTLYMTGVLGSVIILILGGIFGK